MSQCAVKMLPRVPLIVILGATGSGKTKLSLTIAQKFGGEIISADSMQVYKGLDIITAKATPEEQSLVPHHLLNVLDPTEKSTVVNFRNSAVTIIDDLLGRAKMPIIVGGTNYYIESLLWNILVDQPPIKSAVNDSDDKLLEEVPAKKPRLDRLDDTAISNQELYENLQRVDPETAKRLHPNNRRKIRRALEVAEQQGRTLSKILEEQRSSAGGSSLGGSLRYPNSIILWVQCEKEILDQRLNDRVDSMMQQGLLQELTDFHQRFNEERLRAKQPPDYTNGILQTIGFKEFHEYLMLDAAARQTKLGDSLLQRGLNDLKMVTRRYARKQLRWVHNRFLGNPKRQVPPVYGLDATDVSLWTTKVEEPAIAIIECYVTEKTCPYTPIPVSREQTGEPFTESCTRYCETCERTFVGNLQWNAHRKSAKHRRRLIKNQKQLEKTALTQGTASHKINIVEDTTDTNTR